MQVMALAVNMAEHSPIAPDHAGVFETTLLSALWPERVHIERLPPLEQVPSPDPGNDDRGPQRHDPHHPLYGVFGPDPRTFDPLHAQRLLDVLVSWLVEQTNAVTSIAKS
jgi:creatinine amidohydrolase